MAFSLNLGLAIVLLLLAPFSLWALPQPDHVVVVIEENHTNSQVIGNPSAPYINALAASATFQAAYFTSYYAVTHPSQPNYLALFSGSTQGVTDDSCPLTFSSPNLAGALATAGFTFAGYSEDLPALGSLVCNAGGSGGYWRKHNPWADWQESGSLPATINRPFTDFPPGPDYSTLPTLSIVVPDQDHDMHDGTVAQADTWLQSNLDGYLQWAQSHNSLLILTWDEDDSSSSNRIPTLFIGPMVCPGTYGELTGHYGCLRTLEDMYGLAYLGNSAAAAPITDCWAPCPTATPTSTPGTPTVTPTPVGGVFTVQAWPNLSRNNSAIHFKLTLPRPMGMKVAIYDLAGELVALIEVPGIPGPNDIPWLPQDKGGLLLASGLYIYLASAMDPVDHFHKSGQFLIVH